MSLVTKKIILDVHGLVPEETETNGQSELAIRLGRVEKWLFPRVSLFVVVTKKMKKHLLEKYPDLSNKNFLLLPIISFMPPDSQIQKDPRLVVYSGGVQEWQRIHLMKDLICARARYDYLILTPDISAFESMFPTVEFPNVKIKYLEGEPYAKALSSATFGFILRKNEKINQVACPTKLYDYLCFKIVPIVEFSGIGDFEELGFVSITSQDFLNNDGFSEKFLADARQANRRVASELESTAQSSLKELKQFLNS